jgi:UDP-GlcNAc:undecaprenyl-phosphate GlcNAc-1-phosphate transferase
MSTLIGAFLIALVTCASLTPFVRRHALRRGVVDRGLSSRKVHCQPTPRLGGIAIVCAFFASLLGLALAGPELGALAAVHSVKLGGFLACAAAIAALGLYDDLKGADAKLKFSVQFAVAALVYASGFRIESIALPFAAPLPLGYASLPFTVLWIVGITNAMNLIDGLDGLAGGIALIAAGTFFAAALGSGQVLMALLAASLGGAALGFLGYNFNPASIFMGDTGSMFLGFVLSTLAIEIHATSPGTVAVLVPVVVLGVPITDTLLAVARRYARGAPLFQADREHIHHRLLDRGLTHRQTVLVLYGISAMFGIGALILASVPALQATLVLAAVALVSGLLLRYLGYMRLEKLTETLGVRRRNIQRRHALRGLRSQLKRAGELDDVWEAVKGAAMALDAKGVGIRFSGGFADVQPRRARFAADLDAARHGLVHTRHAIHGELQDSGVIELAWTGGRNTLDRDTEMAVEQLCRSVHDALNRVELPAEPTFVPMDDVRERKAGMR